MQPSPLSTSRNLPSSKTEALSPLNAHARPSCPPILPAPGARPATSCTGEPAYSRQLVRVGPGGIWPSVMRFFHSAHWLPQSIHAVPCARIPFLVQVEYSMVPTNYICPSPAHRHSGCLHPLAVVGSALGSQHGHPVIPVMPCAGRLSRGAVSPGGALGRGGFTSCCRTSRN